MGRRGRVSAQRAALPTLPCPSFQKWLRGDEMPRSPEWVTELGVSFWSAHLGDAPRERPPQWHPPPQGSSVPYPMSLAGPATLLGHMVPQVSRGLQAM